MNSVFIGALAIALAVVGAGTVPAEGASTPPAGAGNGPKVLASICWHRFGKETRKDPYRISPERLAGELAWLKADGWSSVSLTQVAAALDGHPEALPDKGVLLSVDDGYKAGALGADVFERYGFHAVYFVYPAVLGHGAFLDGDALRKLEARGHEVACHSLTHPNLARVAPGVGPQGYVRWVRRELGESKARLEKTLGHPVDALAWPYGAYNATLAAEARRLGYRQLWSVSGGLNTVPGLDGNRLRRILLEGHPSLDSFKARLNARPAPWGLSGVAEADLLYPSDLPRPVSAPAEAVVALDGRRLHPSGPGGLALPANLKIGFHVLTLEAVDRGGRRETPYLFQVAREEWRPAFEALSEDAQGDRDTPSPSALGRP